MTFEEAVRKWHGYCLDALDAGHATRLVTRLERDAFPVLGKLGLSVITPTDVQAMVRRGKARGSLDVSRRLKQHISQVYRLPSPMAGPSVIPPSILGSCSSPNRIPGIWRLLAAASCRRSSERLTAMMAMRRHGVARRPGRRCCSRC
ncbi:phage integrase central domain-containing protein [Sphingomonas sp. LK11]|uniref:phage integrase central domain-containing protein n=1 Tax=Sphingomonas sp. LK11 TaxID=1390395 RepID=UPI003FA720B4